MSISLWQPDKRTPVPVLRWSPTKWRTAEAMRDKLMRGLGTDEAYIMEEMSAWLGERAVSVHWRKPLRIDEVSRMAATDEVKARPGRP